MEGGHLSVAWLKLLPVAILCQAAIGMEAERKVHRRVALAFSPSAWLTDGAITVAAKGFELTGGMRIVEAATSSILSHGSAAAIHEEVALLDLGAQQFVLIPVSDVHRSQLHAADSGSHWSLLACFPSKKDIFHLDSSRGAKTGASFQNARRIAANVFGGQAKVVPLAVPQQENGYDCGVYVLKFMKDLVAAYKGSASIDQFSLGFSQPLRAISPSDVEACRRHFSKRYADTRADDWLCRLCGATTLQGDCWNPQCAGSKSPKASCPIKGPASTNLQKLVAGREPDCSVGRQRVGKGALGTCAPERPSPAPSVLKKPASPFTGNRRPMLKKSTRAVMKTISKKPAAGRLRRKQAPRSAGENKTHKCSICEKPRHRTETCQVPGAARVRALEKVLRAARSAVRKKKCVFAKRRLHPQGTGDHAKQARIAHTGHGAVRNKRRRAAIISGAEALADQMLVQSVTPIAATQELVRAKYLFNPKCCPRTSCNGKLSALKSRVVKKSGNVGDNLVYYRCAKCKTWHNAVHFGPWGKLKLEPKRLLNLLKWRARQNFLEPVRAGDMTAQLGIRDGVARKINYVLLEAEGKAGLAAIDGIQLKGNLEGDAHALRQTWVSDKNEATYGHELRAARKNTKLELPKAWKLHLRVVGIMERGGKLVLKRLDAKLVHPLAKPPVESYPELVASKLIDHVQTGSCLNTDGAWSWKRYVATHKGKKRILSRNVVHSKMEYVKKAAKVRGLSALVGTQAIDRAWQSLDRFLPATMNSKRGMRVWSYVHAWLWRRNLACRDGQVDWYSEVGHACERARRAAQP